MSNVEARSLSSRRAKDVAFVGLAVALIAVSAWVVIPLGPIPFTLQMFAIPLMIMILTPSQAIAAIIAYILLGAIGVPVFSGFRGGFGALMGPTGGFLLAYLVAVPVAAGLLYVGRQRLTNNRALFACEIGAGLVFTLLAYLGGWIQYSFVAGVSLEAAFVVSVAPFIVPDIVKVVLAAFCAKPIQHALR